VVLVRATASSPARLACYGREDPARIPRKLRPNPSLQALAKAPRRRESARSRRRRARRRGGVSGPACLERQRSDGRAVIQPLGLGTVTASLNPILREDFGVGRRGGPGGGRDFEGLGGEREGGGRRGGGRGEDRADRRQERRERRQEFREQVDDRLDHFDDRMDRIEERIERLEQRR
jgi:hypothetical protein